MYHFLIMERNSVLHPALPILYEHKNDSPCLAYFKPKANSSTVAHCSPPSNTVGVKTTFLITFIKEPCTELNQMEAARRV